MNEKELEKILKSFHRVKAPHELDERLAPLMTREKRKRWFFRVSLAFGVFLFVILFYGVLFKGNTKSVFYEPLYAALTVPGYFETTVNVLGGERLRVIFDGQVIKDTFFTQDENYALEFSTSRGLHYIIIEVKDAYGNEKFTKTIDLYSL